MSFTRRSFALAIGLLALPACGDDGLGPATERHAGTYPLTAVAGRGPASGTVTLSADGTAERRVRHLSNGTLSGEDVAQGTFRPRADGTVDLQLRARNGQSEYVWRPTALLHEGLLVLRSYDPADGPDILETYQR